MKMMVLGFNWRTEYEVAKKYYLDNMIEVQSNGGGVECQSKNFKLCGMVFPFGSAMLKLIHAE